MSVAVPMEIKDIRDNYTAVVGVGDNQLIVNISMLEDPQIGDYVMVHAGLAIEKIYEEDIAENLELMNQLKSP